MGANPTPRVLHAIRAAAYHAVDADQQLLWRQVRRGPSAQHSAVSVTVANELVFRGGGITCLVRVAVVADTSAARRGSAGICTGTGVCVVLRLRRQHCVVRRR